MLDFPTQMRLVILLAPTLFFFSRASLAPKSEESAHVFCMQRGALHRSGNRMILCCWWRNYILALWVVRFYAYQTISLLFIHKPVSACRRQNFYFTTTLSTTILFFLVYFYFSNQLNNNSGPNIIYQTCPTVAHPLCPLLKRTG